MTHPERRLRFQVVPTHGWRYCLIAPAVLAVLVALPSHSVGAQGTAAASPTCRTSLDSIDARVRQNYAGFVLEVRGERRRAYDTMLRRLARAADTTSLDSCFPVLRSYASWYDDPHLFVFQRQSTDSLAAARRAASLRRLPLSEPDVRASLGSAGRTLDPIEGIWYEGPLRLAVVRDPNGGNTDFVAVVQVLIYAGAISVLMIFAVLLTPRSGRDNATVSYAAPCPKPSAARRRTRTC